VAIARHVVAHVKYGATVSGIGQFARDRRT
jgi:hypothetical protein